MWKMLDQLPVQEQGTSGGFEETDKTDHKACKDGRHGVVGGSGQDGGDPSEAAYGFPDSPIRDGDEGGGREFQAVGRRIYAVALVHLTELFQRA